MKFSKTDLQEMAWGESERFTKVKDEVDGNGRWSIYHSVIFKDTETGKHYSSSYSVGATECQDEKPYEYESDEIECCEVVEKEVVVKQWVPAESGDEISPKSLIKDGCVLKNRNDYEFVTIPSMDIDIPLEESMPIATFNDDLTSATGEEYDIMEVSYDGKILWERK